MFDASTGTVRRGAGTRLDLARLTGNELRTLLPTDTQLCIVIDELDRPKDPDVARHIAELCKNISTYQQNLTLVLVGVAETATALLRGHTSIARNLRQIPLDRMSNEELSDILRHAEKVLNLRFSTAVEKKILESSDRMPYFLHLLGVNAAKHALERSSANVEAQDYADALKAAAADCDASLRDTYDIAILSKQNSLIYRRTIWAIAESDLPYVAPSDVEIRANEIARTEGDSAVSVQAIGQALKALLTAAKRRIVSCPQAGIYRFTHPLMRGYVRLRRDQGRKIS